MRIQRSVMSVVFSLALVGLFAVAGSLPSAQQATAARNPLGSGADVVAAGRVVFDQACQSCHAPAGAGDRGPALNTGVFTHG
jgi:mono/diheme cytochrome c family protein